MIAVGLIRALARRFPRDHRGATMVEFAFVAPIFLFLVFVALEDALMVFTQAQLDNATRDASRTILLGTFQKANSGLSDFQTAVCNGIVGLIPSCGTNVQVYAQADGTDPTNLSTASSSYWDGTSSAFTAANIGGAKQYQLIQVGYQYPFFISWLAKVAGSSTMIISTVVFQIEPYQ